MRFCSGIAVLGVLLSAHGADAQSKTNLQALQGLVSFAVLGNTSAGKAALAANYSITGAIQTGTASQPSLQPFPAQQQQALKDAFITSGNANELADGFGTKLGGAYQALANYSSTDDGKTSSFTNISPAVATLIAYTATLTGSDSNSGKFFFASAVQKTTGPAVPISAAAAAILKNAGGKTDVFGTAYNKPAGSPGADPYGDSRPYQTETNLLKYTDPDFFNAASGNADYLYGPAQNLEKSPSFPSGHTTYGYTESMLLALLVPQRYTQMVVRGAEYGNSRIVLGAHYAMDVIAGRTLAYYDLAHLLAGNPTYVGQTEGKVTITNYQAALKQAESDVTAALTKQCGEPITACAAADTSRFSNAATDEAFYESTQTYGLPAVYPAKRESVAKLAPEAGWLLKAAFPKLTLAQADHILTETEGPGGGFLDNGSSFGVYSRLDLFKAGEKAEALAAK
jgi:membrane-associated phospholipid phosphatase